SARSPTIYDWTAAGAAAAVAACSCYKGRGIAGRKERGCWTGAFGDAIRAGNSVLVLVRVETVVRIFLYGSCFAVLLLVRVLGRGPARHGIGPCAGPGAQVGDGLFVESVRGEL